MLDDPLSPPTVSGRFAGDEMQGGRDKGSTTNSLVKTGNRKNYLVPYTARSG
jgi:hypothetical protein